MRVVCPFSLEPCRKECGYSICKRHSELMMERYDQMSRHERMRLGGWDWKMKAERPRKIDRCDPSE